MTVAKLSTVAIPSHVRWRAGSVFEFGEHSVDLDRRELRRAGELIAVEPQVFDLLVYLIRNRDRVVSKDDLLKDIWGGRIVSDSTLTSRIYAARRAIGDTGTEQALIKTMARKGVRFIGAVTGGREPTPPAPEQRPAPDLRQEIRFCTGADKVRIAYASVGEGPLLVKAANWFNHLEHDWQSPIWSHLLRELATGRRLVRYDARGNGLSDWDVDDLSFEAFVRDIDNVVAAARLERFALLGISQGCAVSIAYAVRHPEQVSRLILYGGYARGKRQRGSLKEIDQAAALITLIRQGWGQENPAFRQIFTSLFVPGATVEQMQWFNDLQRKTASPENAARLREAVDGIDVTDLLPKLQVPTLVLHCRGDDMVPFDEGRRLAAAIPGARFVALESRNHLLLQGEPAWFRFIEEVNQFLRG
jgi:pimeloyl-ACP methyl ester carboxylesterase/DNA-binding winged helix-turn-helix (wHTH) protein